MKSEKTSGETAPLFVQSLEVFPDIADHFALRLCAGRLYNAGIKKSALANAFGMDIRTGTHIPSSTRGNIRCSLAGRLP